MGSVRSICCNQATSGIKDNRHCKCSQPLKAKFTFTFSHLKTQPDLGEKMAPKLVFVLPVVLLSLALQAILRPPPPKLCGSPGGPPLTSPRIKLRDGRYLAYTEDGVQKDKARYKIITVHAFDSTKDFPLPVSKVNQTAQHD
jgi:hypothetical protein